VPELDYALLAEHVRLEPSGLAHVISGGTNVIKTTEMPTVLDIGLLLRVSFERVECERPHRVEVILQDEDGERFHHLTETGIPTWPDGYPVTWKSLQPFAFNFSVPLKKVGLYEFVIMVNDNQVKTLPYLVVLGQENEPSNGQPYTE